MLDLLTHHQYDYVELTRELKVPDDDDSSHDDIVDEGVSMQGLQGSGAGMAMTGHHEKNQGSVDSSNQLAEWAHNH